MLTDHEKRLIEECKTLSNLKWVHTLVDIIDRQSKALECVDDWACAGNIENYRQLSEKMEDIMRGES